jgi:hypothetical protein
MIHGCAELHNVAEVKPVAGGAALQRVPETVRGELNETAQMRVRQPDNVEIRFVCDGPARVTLSSEGATDAVVFLGPLDARVRYRIGRKPETFEVPGLGNRLAALDPAHLKGQPFDARVRRVIFGGHNREPVVLHGIEGKEVRPPSSEMLPRRRCLAYGTSITQGFDCEGPHLSYVAQAARQLKVDLINLGVGGACLCEAAYADYIASRDDWDMAVLELSVNMRHLKMEDFRRRVDYLVNTVAGSNPRRPVACMTLFPFFADYGAEDPGAVVGGTTGEFRQALRDTVKACPHRNVSLVEGPDLLTDIGGLTADLIHPGDYGMQEIGLKLADRLRSLPALRNESRSG